jgi:hypothetical protein
LLKVVVVLMFELPTIAIANSDEDDFIIINESDFDSAVMILWADVLARPQNSAPIPDSKKPSK